MSGETRKTKDGDVAISRDSRFWMDASLGGAERETEQGASCLTEPGFVRGFTIGGMNFWGYLRDCHWRFMSFAEGNQGRT